MKKLVLILLLLISVSTFAAKRYISPTGSDANAGTISAPRFSVASAWSLLSSTDTLYVRGGTYNYTAVQWLNGRSGNSSHYTCCFAYPGEKPIFSFGAVVSAGTFGFISQGQDYVHIRGIRVTNFPQQPSGSPQIGMSLTDGSDYCLVEMCEIDHIGGYGFTISGNSTNNLILNCDSHHNSDFTYGASNGFGCTGTSVATNNKFKGCRSYYNSDDGFDFFGVAGYFEIDSCWSFCNGYSATLSHTGDGVGFKMGPNTTGVLATYQRKLTNCVAFDNWLAGFGANFNSALANHFPSKLYNCTAFRNGVVVGGVGFHYQYFTDVHEFKNCLAYLNAINTQINSSSVQTTNSWNGFTVSNADFVSIDTAGVTGPRQANGNLPALNFLKLKEGSDLINTGTDIGLPFQQTAPDIGAYEYNYVSVKPKILKISGKVQKVTTNLIKQ